MVWPIKIAIPLTARCIEEVQAAVDATMIVDLAQIRALRREGKRFDLYREGIRYRREQRRGHYPDVERFQTIRSMLITRWADCDDLAPALAAQRVLEGRTDARPIVVRSPGIGFHVVVRYMDSGEIEDPSARLGML